jgi:hypothetical protein
MMPRAPKPKKEPPNLLEMVPRRLIGYETDAEGMVTLKAPRFHHPVAARFFRPFLRSPTFDLRLDDFGSFVWLACDGTTDVAAIGERLKERFGEEVEPLWERLGKFLRKLDREDFLQVRPGPE